MPRTAFVEAGWLVAAPNQVVGLVARYGQTSIEVAGVVVCLGGDGFMLQNCMFKNIHNKGEGAGFISEGYNALTNPIINSKFDNVDCAVIDARGSFNFYGNQLTNIAKAGLEFRSVVGNGFALR